MHDILKKVIAAFELIPVGARGDGADMEWRTAEWRKS